MSDLKDYIEDLNDLPGDVLLGRIVVYTIYDHPMKLSDVEDWFKDLDLDPSHVPHPNKPHDAFRKATKELDGTKYDMPGGRTGILLCREVTGATRTDFTQRSIVREIRDQRARRLTHTEAIAAFYYKNNGFRHKVRSDLLEVDEIDIVKRYARKMYERYTYHTDYLDNMKIRGMVRSYLRHLNCVEIKPGVYYVNRNHDDELHRLSELVNRLGGGCHMSLIPIVNIARERELITKMFEREASDQLATLTKEISELMTSRKKISGKMYAKMEARFNEVIDNANEHMVTLDVTQDLTKAASAVASSALQKLQAKMLSEG